MEVHKILDLTVDGNEPDTEMQSPAGYYPNRDSVLLVQARDATTPIAMVRGGLSADGGATYDWHEVPRCQDTADNRSWCYLFSPTAEGRYLLRFQAVDQVGNADTSLQDYELLVDGTPPVPATAIQPGQIIRAFPQGTSGWHVPIAGTATDPGIPGTDKPGSGFAAARVHLAAATCPTPTCSVQALSPQAATVNGDTWSVEYFIPYPNITGIYTLSVQTKDNVGNVSDLIPLTTIGLDSTPPAAWVEEPAAPTTTVATTLTVTGVMTDVGEVKSGVKGMQVALAPAAASTVGDAVALFHFDEPTGTTFFASAMGGLAYCDGSSCPEAGVKGMWGRAVRFDGSTYLRSTSAASRAGNASTLSFGAWVYPTGEGTILAFGDADGHIRNAIRYSNNRFWYVDPDVGVYTEEKFPADQWYRVMVTIDEDGKARIYVNGEQKTICYPPVDILCSWEEATTAYRPDPDGALIIGAQPNGDSVSDQFNGIIDEVTIYRRVLDMLEMVPYYSEAVPSTSGPGVISTTWTYTIPQGVEGIYNLYLRPYDVFDNAPFFQQPEWQGVFIDRRPPRAKIKAREDLGKDEVTGFHVQVTDYHCQAWDFNIDPASFRCPCQWLAPHATVYTMTYYHEASPWYNAVVSDTGRLYSIEASCEVPGKVTPEASMRACDTYGRCTTAYADPVYFHYSAAIISHIMTPTNNAVITSPLPLNIEGYAYARSNLAKLQVFVDGQSIGESIWDCTFNPISQTKWSMTWLTPVDGNHIVTAVVTDCMGESAEDHGKFIVDLTPPVVDMDPLVFTTTHRLRYGCVRFSGNAVDNHGIFSVTVKVDGGQWSNAYFNEGRWQFDHCFGYDPENEQHALSVRATDIGGHTTRADAQVIVDLIRPNPITLTLSTAGNVITPGMVLRNVPSLLTLTWVTSTQRADMLPYQVIWTIHTTRTTQFSHPVPVNGPFISQYPAGDGQRIKPRVVSRFVDGNRQVDTWGEVYVDSPLTPDYISMEHMMGKDHPYWGWMESGCTQMGVDRRVKWNSPYQTPREGEQQLYVTWDSQALRLAWVGANWDYAGDLFIYLDTIAGGTLKALLPYTLTGVIRAFANFDHAIWVKDSTTAYLLTWDEQLSKWTLNPLPAGYYRFYEGIHGGHTDLYIPFDLIGIDHPEVTPLGLIAFATEEGSPKIWSTFPPNNPVDSDMVAITTDFAPEEYTLVFPNVYLWPNLGPGICPNAAYGDADIHARLTADPEGTTYGFMSSELFWLGDELLTTTHSADLSQSFYFMDFTHPPLSDGDVVTYTIHYINRGTTSTMLRAYARALYALRLDGADTKDIDLGNIGPGESKSVTFHGQVDLSATYDACVQDNPGTPEICEPYRRWASLGVIIYDVAHGINYPLDVLWADHQVDSGPPQFFGILQPEVYIGAGDNTLYGYAYDPSGVPTITLRYGGVTDVCYDPSPDDGEWTCVWNATAANGGVPPDDGAPFDLEFQVTDGRGHTSDWNHRLFIVDARPPTVTFSTETLLSYQNRWHDGSLMTVRGVITDERSVGGVEVCLEDECQTLALQAEYTPTYTFDDVPTEPITIGMCSGGEIVRTFNVTTHIRIDEVRLGLSADHPRRNDILAVLESPLGTQVTVVMPDDGTPPPYQNYNVLLYDGATAGLHEFYASDDLELPYFSRYARPAMPLQTFYGEDAYGVWKLSICDTDPLTAEGAYIRSRLSIKPTDIAPRVSDWAYTFSFPDGLDGVSQTVKVYGFDHAGNRSHPITMPFRVDNVAPVIVVSSTVYLAPVQPSSTTVRVLTGTVSDGSGIRRMEAFVQTPEGDLLGAPVGMGEDGRWWYDLELSTPGSYRITVSAVDKAENAAVTWPYTVTVLEIGEGVLVAEVDPNDTEPTYLVYVDNRGLTTTVTIPPGAVNERIILVFTPILSFTYPLPDYLVYAGHAFDLQAYRNGIPIPGYVFSKPITITINYTDTELGEAPEDALGLYYWNDNKTWLNAACRSYEQDMVANWISVPICHLTPFALLGSVGRPIGGYTFPGGRGMVATAVVAVTALILVALIAGYIGRRRWRRRGR